MRHRDPHDDPPAKRRPAPYSGAPVTLRYLRAHGVRRLLIYCSEGLDCCHSATIEADRWPDETAVWDLCPKAVCTKCGMIGADVRPIGANDRLRRALPEHSGAEYSHGGRPLLKGTIRRNWHQYGALGLTS